jgi:hypothetical protein
MALQGFLLRAEQSDPILCSAYHDAIEPGLEVRLLGEAVVAHLSIDVAALILAASSKLCSKEDIADPSPRKDLLEVGLAKVRIDTSVGHRPDVGNRCDGVFVQ